ncbi:amidase domain-containing protein [Homoserinibacter sp. GY 40078]|uniref:amidase domain-containing protein n=1 Tax=Homoserinibacter sp. GY 40078 TaxID=2603275 RepID=UPI0011CB36CE|nr:amidase domain-containing protein [Homoserinibacter sp. GY 40078]TXK18693.1 hypothetical protein FVQ89_01750 [Homoserinibacter sp. GY 40078]
MSVLENPPRPTPEPLVRPRDRRRAQLRRRRIVALIIAAAVVVGIVLVAVLVPPAIARAVAVSRYDTAAAKVAELRQGLDDAFAAAGVDGGPAASVAQVDAVLAGGSPLVTSDAADALRAAADDASAAVAGDDAALLTRPALDTATASVADLDAESAVLESGLASLTATVAAAPDQVAAAAAELQTAWSDFRASLQAEGASLLSDYADAEKSTEDAFATALATVQDASAGDLPAALDAATAASQVMIADAEDYRAKVVESATGAQPTGGDVSAQLEYLNTYWKDYNLADWGDYNAYGGDCVNFTSQGLIARGWKMDGTWSSPGANGFASKAWISTTAMEAYLKSLGFVSHGADDLDRVRPGDVGIFDWGETGSGVDHTMTVSKVEYTADGPIVYFVSHNEDGDARELQHVLYEQHTDSTVRIYSIA